jgi:hypothetical protein
VKLLLRRKAGESAKWLGVLGKLKEKFKLSKPENVKISGYA